ncbi:MAG: type II restriction enzyme [bacterium]
MDNKIKTNKKEIITEIFNICKKNNNFIFDNKLIKDILRQFKSNTNPYDMTKLDNTKKFPDILLKEDYFIAHIGNGKHQFVRDINKVFHEFEEIQDNEIIKWPYRPSILNDFSESESSVLSLCFNQRIMHDFLYQDIVSNPKIYNSERKKGVSFNYKIGDLELSFENLQIEIDLTTENNGFVTVFEGKNAGNSISVSPSYNWLKNFNIFQLYNPFRYYYELKERNKLNIKKLTACYLIRQKTENGSIIRLYNYIFEDPINITSIKLVKKNEYILGRRALND